MGVKFSKILRKVAHKGGPDRFRIFWGALVKRGEVNITGWG